MPLTKKILALPMAYLGLLAAPACAPATTNPPAVVAAPRSESNSETATAAPTPSRALAEAPVAGTPSREVSADTEEIVMPALMPRLLAATNLDATSTNGIPHTEVAASFRPVQTRIRVGGPSDLRRAEETDACVGNVPVRPQYIINVSAPIPHLRIYTTGSGGQNDFTISVGTPSGHLICRDDGAGESTDPDIDLYDLPPGSYRVWVGDLVLTAGRTQGVLHVTTESRPDRVDPHAPAVANAISFSAGANPQRVELEAGGDLAADAERFGACAGHTTRAPTTVLNVSDSPPLMRLYVSDAHNVDTTLLVHGPNDTWFCNDDSFASKDPTINIRNPASGSYQVWVGVYNPGETSRVRLNVTASTSDHP